MVDLTLVPRRAPDAARARRGPIALGRLETHCAHGSPSEARAYQPLAGRKLFDADSCQYADTVRPGDLIDADFDTKEVHVGGGLYLVEAVESGEVVWRGCRRMIRGPDGIKVDESGRGDWVSLPSLAETGWRIAGIVKHVYRPA